MNQGSIDPDQEYYDYWRRKYPGQRYIPKRVAQRQEATILIGQANLQRGQASHQDQGPHLIEPEEQEETSSLPASLVAIVLNPYCEHNKIPSVLFTDLKKDGPTNGSA